MPKIDVSKGELERLVGREFGEEELETVLMFAKGELDGLDGDDLKVDIKDTNRPDLWSVEGIAREIKFHLGEKDFLETQDSSVEVLVDPELKDVRPYISCCFVEGLTFTDTMIKDLMALQERLHAQIGRNREKVAIGISNFDLIEPDVFYRVSDETLKFPPLGYAEVMTPKEILEKHPKGIDYKHLVGEKIPILVDKNNQVISMPPIINSNTLGRIDENTKNVFVDVTGTDKRLVDLTLLVLAMNFAERGGKVSRVKIKDFGGERMSPNLDEIKVEADLEECKKLCGLELEDNMLLGLLERAGCRCEISDGKIKATYPPHRKDVFEGRDLIEDLLISYGYNNLIPQKLEIVTTGAESKKEKLCGAVEELLVGSGFLQAVSFVLNNEENENAKMGQAGTLCKITNPMNRNYTVVRRSLLPSLMDFLTKNQHNEFPQKVFEIGKVIINGNEETTFASAVISNSSVNYEEISSILEALVSNLGFEFGLEETADPRFIEGRVAKVLVGKTEAGVVGELSPQVLLNFGLETPTTAFEIDLKFLFSDVI